MHRPDISRRLVLGLMVSLVAVAAVAGGGPSASAEPKKRPDWKSKDQFKTDCEVMEGEFVEDRWGDTFCFLPDGSSINCDGNGKDCYITPPPKTHPPIYPQDPYVLPGDGATADPGGTVAPGRAQVDDSRVVLDGGDEDKPKKKAKKRGRGGKRGKR